jgi:hypothetical protein
VRQLIPHAVYVLTLPGTDGRRAVRWDDDCPEHDVPEAVVPDLLAITYPEDPYNRRKDELTLPRFAVVDPPPPVRRERKPGGDKLTPLTRSAAPTLPHH